MMETTEQIQTPAVPESPVAEIPAQSSEPRNSSSQRTASQDEAALTAEITELWRLHTDYKGSIRNQTENLRSLRAELGKKLCRDETGARTTRSRRKVERMAEGHKIARATADRLVLKYERSLNPDGNRLTESISEPTEAEIQTLLDKLSPKLRRVLRTPASAYRFVELFASSFAMERRVTEEGLVIAKRSQTTGLEEPVPEAQDESTAEPVPVIAEVQAEVDSESMGTSAAF